jgi:hypothetical protein
MTVIAFLFGASDAPEAAAIVFQAAVIVILFTLLVWKELIRVIGAVNAEKRIQRLNGLIAPVLLLFALMIAAQLANMV